MRTSQECIECKIRLLLKIYRLNISFTFLLMRSRTTKASRNDFFFSVVLRFNFNDFNARKSSRATFNSASLLPFNVETMSHFVDEENFLSAVKVHQEFRLSLSGWVGRYDDETGGGDERENTENSEDFFFWQISLNLFLDEILSVHFLSPPHSWRCEYFLILFYLF